MTRYDFVFWQFNDILSIDTENSIDAGIIDLYKKNCNYNKVYTDDELWYLIYKCFEENFDQLLYEDIEYWKTHPFN